MWGSGGGRGPALYRVVLPRQNVVVRLSAGDLLDSPEEHLPAIRPYGALGMAWAIWREVPDIPPGAAFALARRARKYGEAVILEGAWPLVQHARSRLLARHLVTRLERVG
jgi:hypothetical protein